jgi:hypothetical protein
MTGLRQQGSIVRGAALIVLGALAVHQLRYLLAYGSAAHEQLQTQGHGYLLHALPALIGFATAALAARLIRAALRSPDPRLAPAREARTRLRSWEAPLLYAGSIAAVFAIQETAEGLLFSGHPAGLDAVVGAGAWVAIPLALLVGALCALLDGGLARLESLVAGTPRSSPRVRAPRRQGSAASRVAVPLASLPLAFGLARRPPPALGA